MAKKEKLAWGILLCVVFVHILYAVFWGSQKATMVDDEYLTFVLANGPFSLQIEEETPYTGTDVFIKDMVVSNGLDYAKVWDNQSRDNHPPLYYAVIHTLCAMFPNQFSKWFGLIPNIAFMAITDVLLFCLCKKLFNSKGKALAVTAANALSFHTMSLIMFLRMYAFSALWIVAISYLFVQYWDKPKNKGFWLGLYLITAAGVLTHYFFLIYLFYICLFFGIGLILQKRKREVGIYIGTLAAAGVSALLIYHDMWWQVLTSRYSRIAQDSLIHITDQVEKFLFFCDTANNEVFGGIFWPLAGVCLVVIAVCPAVRKKLLQTFTKPLGMICFSGAANFLTVAFIASIWNSRYVMPIGWVAYVAGVWLLSETAEVFLPQGRKAWANAFAAGVFAVTAVLSLRINDWEPRYVYAKEMRERMRIAEQYSENDVLYVYDGAAYEVHCNMWDLGKYASFVIVRPENVGTYLASQQKPQKILYVLGKLDNEELWDQVLNEKTKLTNKEFLYQADKAAAYYLS